ncbi:putative acetyltransferase [Anatilimnocola aggregata]|uniref:Putative acetyltransferase n=1 Tax=Anatilimnocola aggregata TaxID=2528021 RepID=A0A517YHW7_9BACT|nr:GNAT family N-acetyltransferase [Anatilimnocola aggregata]QDU29809.1 putative acetyltransferase [Anatilimnocola aggregata]
MKLPVINAEPLWHERGEPSAALQLAAAAWHEAERAAQVAIVLRTVDHQPPRFKLVAAHQDDALVGAVLAECLPGRAAVVMQPRITDNAIEPGAIAGALLQGMNQALRADGTLLAQALTKQRSDEAAGQFQASGYYLVGDLLYLAADLTAPLAEDEVAENELAEADSGFQLIAHDPDDFARWGPLLDQTYIGTLDCPAVDGLRPTSDVLKGYRDIGRPRSDWWFIVRHQGEDVGCLLLAEHAEMPQTELIYMALVPAVRGRGWGLHLVQHGLRVARETGAQHMILSVDADNAPALRHYVAAGFRVWERRAIWVHKLA